MRATDACGVERKPSGRRRGVTPIERYAMGYDVLVTYISRDAACFEPSGYERGRRAPAPGTRRCRCLECRRAWLSEQRKRDWQRFEANDRYPRRDRFLRWLRWHDVSGWVLELLLLYCEAMDLVLAETREAAAARTDAQPSAYTQALLEMRATRRELYGEPLPGEEDELLKRQLDHYDATGEILVFFGDGTARVDPAVPF